MAGNVRSIVSSIRSGGSQLAVADIVHDLTSIHRGTYLKHIPTYLVKLLRVRSIYLHILHGDNSMHPVLGSLVSPLQLCCAFGSSQLRLMRFLFPLPDQPMNGTP